MHFRAGGRAAEELRRREKPRAADFGRCQAEEAEAEEGGRSNWRKEEAGLGGGADPPRRLRSAARRLRGSKEALHNCYFRKWGISAGATEVLIVLL